MDETVEVYRGDLVQIPCQYNFTDNAKPSLVMIQWFVVSPAAGGQDRAGLGLSFPFADLSHIISFDSLSSIFNFICTCLYLRLE